MQHSPHLRPLALTLVMVSLLQVSLWQSQTEQLQASIFGDIHDWVFGSSSSSSVAPKPATKPKPAAPAAPASSAAPESITPPVPTVIVPYVPPVPVYFTVEGYRFPRTIRTGMKGDDVLNLQLILNRNPLTQMAKTGVESPGQESATYDYKTRIALIAFQKLNFLTDAQKVRLHREQGVAGLTTRQILEKLAKDLVAQGKLPSDSTNLHAAAQSAASSLRMLQSSFSSRSRASVASTASQEAVSSATAQTSSIASANSIASQASSVASTVTSVASSIASIASAASSMQSVAPNLNAHAFYIDPVNGSKTGDGSAAKPWKTFQDVVAAKLISGDDPAKGVVHGGDTIYLMTGEYGVVRPPATNNTDYITIQAAPGQTPVMTNIAMAAGSKWAFKGITFRNPPGGAAGQLVRITMNDFIFTDNFIYSEADVSTWTPEYWVAHASIALTFTGNNAVISHNTIKNVRRGVTLVGDHIEFTYNTIDVHANDALDFTVSNTLIGHNSITNHYGKIVDGLHNDAMQGWTLNNDVASNVTIDSNTIIESTGAYPWIPLVPSGIDPEYMQGISIFNGRWKNVTVTNNLVVVSAGHAISLYGVQGGLIANNTVIRKTADTVWDTFIALMPLAVDGTEPANIIVRNNLAPSFRMPEKGSNIFDHNIAYLKQWQPWEKSIPVIPMDQIFVQPDPAKGPLDYHLKDGSPAIGVGLADGAPLVDLAGKMRDANSIDIGAYAK